MGSELRLAYSASQIAEAVQKLAERIEKDYAGKELVLVVVLKGALFFAADLARQIRLPLTLEFVTLRSYSGTSSSGTVSVAKGLDLDAPLRGRDVLIVEDIVDTGLTLQFLFSYLQEQEPQSLKLCTLLDKGGRRQFPANPEYVGITCENRFLVGYGLDLDEKYRELPAIYERIT